MVRKGPRNWFGNLFEYLVFKLVFGCLVWSSTLFMNVGKPYLKSNQLVGIENGQVKPMGWKTEIMFMTLAQIITQKVIGDRSSWECLHTAFAHVSLIMSWIFGIWNIVHSKYVRYLRNPGYRILGLEVPVTPLRTRYSYSKLNDRHIRLVVMYRSWAFKVSYHLIDVDLDNLPRYEAISYTWGNTLEQEEILIDGKSFQTTCTIGDILRRRSRLIRIWPGVMKALWIDYLCINQNDAAEKTKQVQLMREIYQKSSNVMAYLGDEPDASKANWLLIKLESLASELTYEELTKRCLLEYDTPSWHALVRMLSHPYFTRIWVVQELATAPKIYLTYGRGLIEWDLLEWAFEAFARPDMSMLLTRAVVEMKWNLALNLEHGVILSALRAVYQQKTPFSLQESLILCSRFCATDPRDKIFALLGLVSDDGDINKLVDYDKSTEDVYTDTARYLLAQNTLPLRTLNLAGIGSPRSLSNLPSWTPDLSAPPLAGSLEYSTRSPHNYNASGGRRHDPSILLNASHNMIRLDGVYAEEVIALEKGDGIWEGRLTSDLVKSRSFNVIGWLHDILQLSKKYCPDPYFTGQPLEEAFWRTLLGDRTTEGRPAPPTNEESYQAVKLVSTKLNDMPVETQSSYENMADLHLRANIFLTNAIGTIRGRRFCITKKGYMGFAPQLTREGDTICIFAGANTPFLVRSFHRGDGLIDAYHLVGASYFHGMMDGEMWDSNQESKVFTLC